MPATGAVHRNMKEPALPLKTCPLDRAESPEAAGLSARRLQAISSVLNADVDRRKIRGRSC
ncbi:hypothetical protein ACTMU2_26450 [Cupriavidus basilensis]